MSVGRFGLVARLLAGLLGCAAISAQAQFKEIKAAPFSPTVARQRIRAQLASASAENADQVVKTISAWLDWYRDILDDELIARWKSEARVNVPLIMAPLADARIAREVVDYSWRANPAEAFTVDYTAMLGDLIARYPDSGKGFLADLLPPAPVLPMPEPTARAVCRLLMDMPDIGTWHKDAAQILPRYRAVVDAMTRADAASQDQEKSYRALRWRTELRLDPQPVSSMKRPAPAAAPRQPVAVSDLARPHLAGAPPLPPLGYVGPMDGIFEWKGDPVPAFGQCVFADIPLTKLLLDYDTKKWDAQLSTDEAGRQVLVMRNKTKSVQKKCVAKWSVTD